MAKYLTYELHLTGLVTSKLGPNRYTHQIHLRDWDDAQEVVITMVTPYPVIAAYPWKIRVLVEDLPESPPE